MARIAGVDIPKDKQAWIALTYIYGIGQTNSREILQKAQVGAEIRMKDLTDEEVTRIRNVIDKELDHDLSVKLGGDSFIDNLNFIPRDDNRRKGAN